MIKILENDKNSFKNLGKMIKKVHCKVGKLRRLTEWIIYLIKSSSKKTIHVDKGKSPKWIKGLTTKN